MTATPPISHGNSQANSQANSHGNTSTMPQSTAPSKPSDAHPFTDLSLGPISSKSKWTRSIISRLKEPVAAVDRWICEPVDPRPICLFRACFGMICLVNFLLLWPDMPMWLGKNGVLPPAVHRSLGMGPSLNLYLLTGYDDVSLVILKVLSLVGGLGLIFGVWPRLAAFFVWLVVGSFSWRNSFILHSGDNLIRIGSFFLIFARSDGAFSARDPLDRFVGRLTGKRPESAQSPVTKLAKIPAWPQRTLQLQLCILYVVTGLWKAKGIPWQNGTAVGTVLQLGEFQHFPIPGFFATPFMSQVMSYSTLILELGFPFLIWVPRLRSLVLLAGVGLHLGLEWTLNVQLFQWTILSYYLLFLVFKPADAAPHQVEPI
jgi:uncharacterized membrane protein YphA (DoxX/SURF4 family)